MNRRDALGFLTGGVALSLLPRAARAQAAGRKPNVVLVMTDDQGYGDLGCHGNDLMATPNLDSLHAQSVRFTNFHVDPTCSPTRSALMTGRYSSRTGVWHTIMGRSLLGRDEVTVADVFAAAGYATGMFGKWHLGDNYPFRPEDRGFQEVLRHGGGGVGQAPDFWGNDYFDDTYWHNGVPTPFKGYCTDVFFDGALKFIEANKDKPFFAYVPTNAPHGPYRVAEKYAAIYKKKGVKGGRANFWGMITNIDENMGRLLARLEALGLERNTILIFMTDNGTSAGSSARAPSTRAGTACPSSSAGPTRSASRATSITSPPTSTCCPRSSTCAASGRPTRWPSTAPASSPSWRARASGPTARSSSTPSASSTPRSGARAPS